MKRIALLLALILCLASAAIAENYVPVDLTNEESYAMNLKKEFTDHYDWYLYNLSVKKEAQGKGIASKLMRPMLRFCDDECMVAYLETNKEANVGLYEHYGFDLMREERIPKTPVTHYAMVREPICKNINA